MGKTIGEIESRECEACTLTHALFVPGEGAGVGGGVVALGEAGGKWEGVEGRPFVGPAGRIIRPYFDRLAERGYGIDFLTNMVPRALDRTPTPSEVKHSWNCHLRDLLSALKPRALVAIGSVASTFLTKVGVKSGHGSPWTLSQERMDDLNLSYECPVFIVQHPSLVIRHLITPDQFKADMMGLAAWMSGNSRLNRESYIVIGAAISPHVTNPTHPATRPLSIPATATPRPLGDTISTVVAPKATIVNPVAPLAASPTRCVVAVLPTSLTQASLVAVDFETADDDGNPTTDEYVGHVIGVAFCEGAK